MADRPPSSSRPASRAATATRRGDDVARPGWLLTQAGAPRKVGVRHGPPPLSRPACRVAAGLVAVGIGVTVGGWFPVYLRGGGSVEAHTGQLLLHAIPVIAWAAAVLPLAAGRAGPARAGAALAGGSAVVVTGLDLATLGHLVAVGFGTARLGLWLTLGGNLILDAGVGVALISLGRAAELGRPWPVRWAWLPAAALAAAAVGVAYVPGWERMRVTSAVLKQHEVLPTKGTFANAWEVVVGEVVVLLGLAIVPFVAAQWTHRRSAGLVILASVIGVGGLVAETVYQLASPVVPSTIGLTAALVKEYKLRLRLDPSPWFLLELAGLVLLVALGLLLVAGRRPAPR